jgi:hypothetical protein
MSNVSSQLRKHVRLHPKQGLGPLSQGQAVGPAGAGGLTIEEQGLAV